MFRIRYTRTIVAYSLATVGVLCAVACIASFLYTEHFVSTATPAQGHIIKLVESHDDDGPVYYPVFTFQDDHGHPCTVQSNVGSSDFTSYQVGKTVPILYPPSNPREASINSFVSLWILPLVTGILATVWTIISIILLKWPALVRAFTRNKPA